MQLPKMLPGLACIGRVWTYSNKFGCRGSEGKFGFTCDAIPSYNAVMFFVLLFVSECAGACVQCWAIFKSTNSGLSPPNVKHSNFPN